MAEAVRPLPGVRSNNVAEYEGVRAGLGLLRGDLTHVGAVTVCGDSQVVLGHLRGDSVCSHQDLRPLYLSATRLMEELKPRCSLSFVHVRREHNTDADALSNRAMDETEQLRGVTREQLVSQLDAFQRSALGKAASLERLGALIKRGCGKPWHLGHADNTTVLTALGGTVVKGLSRRAQLDPATEEVMRALQRHTNSWEDAPDTPFHAPGQAWAAAFEPQRHYPAGWDRDAGRWDAQCREAEAVARRPRERRGAAPPNGPPRREAELSDSDLRPAQQTSVRGLRAGASASRDLLP